jgi:hypothetical protein
VQPHHRTSSHVITGCATPSPVFFFVHFPPGYFKKFVKIKFLLQMLVLFLVVYVIIHT